MGESNLLVVFGSEGWGISEEIKKRVSEAIYIEQKIKENGPAYSFLDSLNVSISSAIIMQKLINL